MGRGISSRIITMGLLSVAVSSWAQTIDDFSRNAEEVFSRFKESVENDFSDFRDRVNRDFSDFMRHEWTDFSVTPALPVPPEPVPPEPPAPEPDVYVSEDKTLPHADVVPVPHEPPSPPVPFLPPQPVIRDKPESPEKPDDSFLEFDFYGNRCRVPLGEDHRFCLGGIGEKDVSAQWMKLSDSRYVPLIRRCVEYRDSLSVCDWGYLRFVEKMADSFFPKERNESTLLQMFVLTQSGYKVRIGRIRDCLVLLIPSQETIYNYSYVSVCGYNYYIVGRPPGSGKIRMFNREFPKEKQFSLAMASLPRLPYDPATPRRFSSLRDPELETDIAVNRNLIDFFNDYPLSCHWNLNANASLSAQVKEQLYPKLREAVEGKSNPDAADVLLHFVQTAFMYKTDDQQFGYERSFFPDETFFYPYSDCEDRAILYSVLVRELLGLDTVLLCYPGHLATAVCFDEEVKGDHFNIDGRKFMICDPTYINANIGMAMPNLRTIPAEIIRL